MAPTAAGPAAAPTAATVEVASSPSSSPVQIVSGRRLSAHSSSVPLVPAAVFSQWTADSATNRRLLDRCTLVGNDRVVIQPPLRDVREHVPEFPHRAGMFTSAQNTFRTVTQFRDWSLKQLRGANPVGTRGIVQYDFQCQGAVVCARSRFARLIANAPPLDRNQANCECVQRTPTSVRGVEQLGDALCPLPTCRAPSGSLFVARHLRTSVCSCTTDR